MQSADPTRRNFYLLLGGFLLLTTSLGAAAYRLYLNQRSQIEDEVRKRLDAVAELKVGQVVAWRRDRLADAKILSAQTIVAVRKVLQGSTEARIRERTLSWMRAIREASSYANVILVAPSGKECLSLGRISGAEEVYATLMNKVLESGQVFFSDFHYDAGIKGPHLGLNIPLRFDDNQRPEGALLLGIDPNQFLYPLIQSWPGASRSAETLLARREGNEVVFLNDLRYRPGSALNLRVSLDRTDLPVVRAALGFEGITNGIDYRGVPVLAATRKVPDTPWVLVAKVDIEEVYAPLRAQALWLGLMACALVLAMGAGAGLWWRHLRALSYRQKYEAELERRQAEEERAKLQEQLQQAQKMESIGRLAGGIAHDFNNLLTVINGYAAVILSGLGPDHPLRVPISEIGTAGERAAELTSQLLAFSRKQIIQPKVVDLNAAIRDVAKMLGRIVGEDVQVSTSLAPGLGRVLADPGQVHQVIMNLVVNARDAMPRGGRLLIETDNVDIDDEYVAAHAETKPGPYVLLAVTDTGAGMDDQTRRRAFEPFFTTKPKGEGTGLGLSTVYGIIKQSGGWIWLYSEAGKGTTFKIYLPRTADAPEQEPGERTDAAKLKGTETVLVVEDQGEVRTLIVAILKRYGYNVQVAANGPEALALEQRISGPIDVLVTDVVMPGMNGRELAARLSPLRPGMKILFISGYTANAMSQDGTLDPGMAFLAKPFAPEALAERIRQLLE